MPGNDDEVLLPSTALERLDETCREHISGNFPDLAELDGFLTAVMVRPVPLDPAQWMPHVWRERAAAPEFASDADRQAVVDSVLLRCREIANQLAGSTGLTPALKPGPYDTFDATDWADGFRRGMALSDESWDPLMQDEMGTMVFQVFAALTTDPALHDSQRLDEDFIGLLRTEAPEALPGLVGYMDTFWKERRAEPAAG